jgi:4-carboxymuconolactone decarboxylase
VARIELIPDDGGLDAEVRRVADRIVETRGEISRPFQLLLHAPTLAERVADLGHAVRSGSGLSDADRELATLATGVATGCGFVWTSHVAAAGAAGLPRATIDALREGRLAGDRRAARIAGFATELGATGTVSADTFAGALELLGTERLVELATTVGYYTMIARVMSAFGACSDA